MSIRRSLTAAITTALLGAGLVAAPTTAAHAAGSCWITGDPTVGNTITIQTSGITSKRPIQYTFNGISSHHAQSYTLPDVPGAYVYAQVATADKPTGNPRYECGGVTIKAKPAAPAPQNPAPKPQAPTPQQPAPQPSNPAPQQPSHPAPTTPAPSAEPEVTDEPEAETPAEEPKTVDELVDTGDMTPSEEIKQVAKLRNFTTAPKPVLSTDTIKVGMKLEAVVTGWSPKPTALVYAWYVDGKPAGEGKTLTITAAMAGKPVYVVVGGKRDGYLTSTRISSVSMIQAAPKPKDPKVVEAEQTQKKAEQIKTVTTDVNAARTQNGLKALPRDSRLDAEAQRWADKLGQNCKYFEHNQGGNPKVAGFSRTMENLFKGYGSTAVGAWMNSPGHRANILKSDHTHFGVGYNAKCGGIRVLLMGKK
ncbi:MAG: CAP domain-containing protein [Aeromicrobium sp.]|uniref:CAP domain-containing protein n=1 Tax=Aeromicrobium sp. TaxID=1871063 RepID=UPI0039E4740B